MFFFIFVVVYYNSISLALVVSLKSVFQDHAHITVFPCVVLYLQVIIFNYISTEILELLECSWCLGSL